MNEIVSYRKMCTREGMRLQKGMVYRPAPQTSVMLMSLRQSAPYPDRYLDDGATILYQGHDPEGNTGFADQSLHTRTGNLSENGKFYHAAMGTLRGFAPPTKVRVYQKLMAGIWCFNGHYFLTDAWEEYQDRRKVYLFRLEPEEPNQETESLPRQSGRYIPSHVKARVFERDGGRCVICGSSHDLHFDHIIPVAKGGSSTSAKNIQLLCARHNLIKSDKIQ